MAVCAECSAEITGRRLCLPCWEALKRASELAAMEVRAANPEWKSYWRKMREELEAEQTENR